MAEFNQISLKGQFIIAMPLLADPNFHKTVTCICEHTAQGAMGMIINRTFPALSNKDILKELKLDYRPDTEPRPIHTGGPVHVDEIFVLHGPPFDWQGCLPVTERMALSNTLDILRAIAEGKGPDSYLITLGCAGWGPGQLEAELKDNAWLTCAIDEDIVFKLPTESRWEAAVRKMGIDPAALTDTAGHA